jgi:hypothetical protein
VGGDTLNRKSPPTLRCAKRYGDFASGSDRVGAPHYAKKGAGLESSTLRNDRVAERSNLAVVMQMLKQNVSQELNAQATNPFWQSRYYDFNVWGEGKLMEKLDYMHQNPVQRGLAARPEDWAWSSARHYATGEEGAVEIESRWTARRREQLGVYPVVRRRDVS